MKEKTEIDEEEASDKELYIERMQTISIRKKLLSNERRKSVYQLVNNCNENNNNNNNNNWNYDELNELKMKFLSLLSSDGSKMDVSESSSFFFFYLNSLVFLFEIR